MLQPGDFVRVSHRLGEQPGIVLHRWENHLDVMVGTGKTQCLVKFWLREGGTADGGYRLVFDEPAAAAPMKRCTIEQARALGLLPAKKPLQDSR